MELQSGDGPVKLVPEDVVLFESSLAPASAAPQAWWPRYLLASLAVVAAAWLLCRLTGPGVARGLGRSWFLVAGTAGLAMLFLWFGTDHAVARLNMNLLVFNPLWLWPAAARGAGRRVLPLVAGFSVLAIVLTALPPHQYTLDVLAAFLPLNIAAAVALGGSPRP